MDKLLKKKKKEKEKQKERKGSRGGSSIELRPEFSVLDEKDVHFNHHGYLGGGMYGKVYKGECFSKPVAIKVLNVQEKDYDDKEEYEADMECLITEVNIMMKNSHPHIMTLIGVCPKTRDGKTLIVMELEDGDLFHLLITKEGRPSAVAKSLSLFDRLKLIKDAALGMEFLHSIEPAIIHRDLKLENLMYKRIDNTFQVRLSDFGLSAVKPKSVKKISSDGRGNNLTKAPEVMLGRDFDTSADVYSFSMCMWEILHCTPLYPDIQDSKDLFEKVVRKGMRPRLPADTLPSLRALLERMWDVNPSHRPTFAEINKSLDEVLIDSAISDRYGRRFWKECFMKDHSVVWNKWVDYFYRAIGCKLPKGTASSPSDSDTQYRCLKALLVVEKKESTDDGRVRIQDFGYFLGWFSGMPSKHNRNILERVMRTLKQSWFHGDIERNEAQRRLEGQQEGTFLVRLSKSTPGSFAITKLEQIKRTGECDSNDDGLEVSKVSYIMKNYAISQEEEGFKFSSGSIQPAVGSAVHDEKFKDLVALIDSFRDRIGLLHSCPGSRFRPIFEGPFEDDDDNLGSGYDPVGF